jgi:DNA-binding CsgD family transcriptional regulator
MLNAFRTEPRIAAVNTLVPPVARPLVAAANAGRSLTDAVQDVVATLGFDHFMYAVAASPAPASAARMYVWTTAPAGWVRRYGESDYLEVDPRLPAAWNSMLPVIWDRTRFDDTPATRRFLDAAAAHGVRSGIALALRNRFDAPAILSLNSALPTIDSPRARPLASVLGEVMALGTYLHEMMLATVVAECLPSAIAGRPLSLQERKCLQLAADGKSGREIGLALSISERTVHTHVANLLGKLGAANLHEAIARGVFSGLVAA